MLGGDKKAAIGYIKDPSTLKELSSMNKLGADNVKSFLKGLGLDASKVDAAVAERAGYEAAVADSKDREKFLAYAQSVDETVTADNLNDLIKDHAKSDPMKVEMAMKELGLSDEAEYKKLESNEALIGLYQQNLPKLLENSHMTNAVIFQFIGIVLIVIALAYFLIQAMDIKPRARTRAVNPKAAKVTGFLLNYALFIILGLILVIVSIIRIDFLSMNNVLNILQNASTKGILALGCAGLIVLAGTDLSIGRVLGISAAVTASLVQSTTYASRMFPTMVSPLGGFGLLVPLLASIAVAVAFCMINGFGVAKLHLHAFIVTLGTQLIAYGANCLYIESQPSGTAQALSTFDPEFLNIAAGAFYIGEIRVPLVVIYFLVLALIVWVIWNKTKLGKNMFAVGGNTEAAAVSGVNVAKTIMLVYLMAGVLYGIASFLEAARITRTPEEIAEEENP
jgi:methyl-galactoside transport system permease protein